MSARTDAIVPYRDGVMGYMCPWCQERFLFSAYAWTCPRCGRRLCNLCLGMGVLGDPGSTNSTTCGGCQSKGYRPELGGRP